MAKHVLHHEKKTLKAALNKIRKSTHDAKTVKKTMKSKRAGAIKRKKEQQCFRQIDPANGEDRKRQRGTAFLWRDRKNNPQENCCAWIKDLESEKADCCERGAQTPTRLI